MKVIVLDLSMQTMGCQVCREVLEIPRRLLRDQHQLLVWRDEVELDHKECREAPADPDKARLRREFRKRCEREMQKQQQPERSARRCNGRPRS